MSQKYYTYLLIDPRNNLPFYVGKGSGRRMYQHQYRRKTIVNQLLVNKINKLMTLGRKIIYEKVLINVNEERALEKEIELIQQYGRIDIGTGVLCNLTTGGQQGASSWSPQSRKRKSEIEKAKKKGRPVSQYSLKGKHIQNFSSAKVAGEQTTANRSYITQCCKGKQRSSGGFLWIYKGDPKPSMKKTYWRKVQQFTLDGQPLTVFNSLTEAQHKTGVNIHNMSVCCRGKSNTAGGFKWEYF